LLIALTVFCTALCGWGYSDAASKAAAAAHQSIELELEMHTRSSRLNAAINSSLQDFALAREHRARYAAARQRALTLQALGQDNAAAMAQSQAAAHALVAKRNPKIEWFLDHPEYGVDGDPQFI
jgi:hypothetical protein